MEKSSATAATFLVASLLCASSCTDPSGIRDDGGGSDVTGATDGEPDVGGADGEADVEEPDVDVEPDGPLGPEAGPLTQVFHEISLLTDRLCDLDGDGDDDNAMAELGSPGAELLAAALQSALQGEVDSGDMRLLLHVPWIDDLRTPDDPDFALLTFEGEDEEYPDDASNDFSGHEPWYAEPFSLDGCGEPLYAFPSASLVGGDLHAEGGSICLPIRSRIGGMGARIEGTVAAGGTASEATACFYVPVASAGSAPGVTLDPELTLLEELLLGGGIIGLPAVSGISPDVDLDGDGLERFVLDEEGQRIASCVDGDDTVIAGEDCWQDERMADAFALVLRLRGVSAFFLDRLPGWRDQVEGTCDEPPETSLFDPR